MFCSDPYNFIFQVGFNWSPSITVWHSSFALCSNQVLELALHSCLCLNRVLKLQIGDCHVSLGCPLFPWTCFYYSHLQKSENDCNATLPQNPLDCPSFL